jgi:hypothetical protein
MMRLASPQTTHGGTITTGRGLPTKTQKSHRPSGSWIGRLFEHLAQVPIRPVRRRRS